MMQFVKKNLLQTALILFLVILPVVSFAQTGGSSPTPTGGSDGVPIITKLQNPIKVNTINEFIKILLEGFLKIGIPIVALAVIYCGFLFVAARGNSEKLTKAKDALLYTLIGATILLGSWAIAKLISDTVLSIGSP